MNKRCTYCGGMMDESAVPTGTGPGAEYLHPACLKRVQNSTSLFTRFLMLLGFAAVAGVMGAIYYFVF